jgi:hypothetical protein
MSRAKILWVQDEYEGPMNGLAEYEGKQVWFSRIMKPAVVSSTNVAVPEESKESSDSPDLAEVTRTYTLYELNPQDMELVTNNHSQHCVETGAPLKHGDPIRIKARSNQVKMTPEQAKAKFPGEFRLKQESLGMAKIYTHKIVPSEVKGEVVATIFESEFENYSIPRMVVRE